MSDLTTCPPTWYGPCAPYLTVEQVADPGFCGPCRDFDLEPVEGEPSADAVLLGQALGWASRRVFLATGQRFFGCCEATIRPCRSACSAAGGVTLPWGFPWGSWPQVSDGWFGEFVPVWSCACSAGDPCDCSSWDRIPLPLLPVRSVAEVKIDGDVLDPATYQVVDQAWLVRTDGGRWPSCQGLGPDTEEGTWSVTYRHGLDLPPEALPLVASYACELATRCRGGDCQLPEGVRVVNRDGVDFAVTEPSEYRDQGLTGFGPVDDWVALLNGGHVQEPPRIYRAGRESPIARLDPWPTVAP